MEFLVAVLCPHPCKTLTSIRNLLIVNAYKQIGFLDEILGAIAGVSAGCFLGCADSAGEHWE